MKKATQFLRENKLSLLLFVIIFLFNGIIESIVNKVLVAPLTSKINLFNAEILFYFLSVLLVFFTVNKVKKNFHIPSQTIFSSILVFVIYFYYRISQDPWTLLSLNTMPFIKILDIIPFSILCILTIKFNYTPPIKNETPPDNETLSKGFYMDKSIGEKGEDKLNRTILAEKIIEHIANTNTENHSFSIGISSEWGGGKTSFLDLLEKEIKKNHDNILIKFNPWINHNSNNIIADFFNTLSETLKEYSFKIEGKLKKYSELLSGVSNNGLIKSFAFILGKFENQNSIRKEFEAIEKSIDHINKKIFIFIDDIDRLYKDEIIQVIKLIRNSANFNNVIFITAYDRDYIVKALKDINNYNPDSYLEKIFQLEIKLPNFNRDILIRQQIYEIAIPLIEKKDKTEFEEILINSNGSFNDNDFKSNHLHTLRDASRYANSLIIAYELLKGEIILLELLNLEILRVKFPSVYALFFKDSNKFIRSTVNADQKKINVLRKNKENKNLIISDYLKNSNNFNDDADTINEIENILLSLFQLDTENNTSDVDLLSIANPVSFERYSFYRLLNSNLSEGEFRKFRRKSLSEFLTKIKSWVEEGKSSDLKNRLQEINTFENQADYEIIIQAIFHLARLKNKDNNYVGFSNKNLLEKIDYDEDSISKPYYTSIIELTEFILKIFTNAPPPYAFESDFINFLLSPQVFNNNFILSKEVLEDIRLKFFKNYLASLRSWDYQILRRYYYIGIEITYTSSGTYQKEFKRNSEATELLIEFIKNYALDGFLEFMIQEPPESKNEFVIPNSIKEIFGGYEYFYEFLKQFDESKYKYLKEYRLFFNVFKERNFEKPVAFNFVDIPVKNRDA